MHRILFVTSTRTGGIPQTNQDLIGALQEGWAGDVEVWHLNCLQAVLSLRRVHPGGREEVVRERTLKLAVNPVTQQSPAYERVVSDWMQAVGFDVVHIHHLAWHSLGLPHVAKALGALVVVHFHDYYHLCPTVKLLDAEGRYCGGHCSQGDADCTPEPMWPGRRLPRLRGEWVGEWRQMASKGVSTADVFIAPHESVRDIITQHLSLPPGRPFHVIPHGRDFERVQWLGQLPKRDQVLKILVPGHLTPAKGLDIVGALARLDGGRRLHFDVLGSVAATLDLPGLTVHGEYRADQFGMLVERLRPHVGAVFSIWNETWCHTLTEMWACGLPVMAFDFPTVGSRIRESGAGWVWPLGSVEDLHARILALDFFELSRKTALAAVWKPTLLRENCREMARRYRGVYGWESGCA